MSNFDVRPPLAYECSLIWTRWSQEWVTTTLAMPMTIRQNGVYVYVTFAKTCASSYTSRCMDHLKKQIPIGYLSMLIRSFIPGTRTCLLFNDVMNIVYVSNRRSCLFIRCVFTRSYHILPGDYIQVGGDRSSVLGPIVCSFFVDGVHSLMADYRLHSHDEKPKTVVFHHVPYIGSSSRTIRRIILTSTPWGHIFEEYCDALDK